MNFKKTLFYILTVGLVTGLVSFIRIDDDPIITKIASQLEKWANTNPQEKVYLQFDKPYYAVGENIWFKAYITVGSEHRLSAISGALNVELIDDRDSVKQYLKLPVTSGIAWGDFALSDTLQEGTYRIRAYTNWMRNAGEDYFFNKTISIGNAATNTVFTKTNFNYSIVNGQQRVNAVINYADLSGNAYGGKPVSYRVQLNDKQIAKGKGITDSQGNLSVDFTNTTAAVLTSGRIITDIQIADKKTVTKTVPVKATSNQANVQFFPEGGSLVNGIRSRVAFKAVGADGLGVDIKGVVTDNDNQEVAAINTRHLGMGFFALAPQAGKTYKAQITYPDGSQNTVNLPQAAANGYVISVSSPDSANVSVRVTSNGNIDNGVYVVAQSGGTIRYVAKSKPGSNTFGTLISKSRFPSGIVQFTLFSSTGEPLNERIAFIQHNDDLLKLNVRANTPSTGVREKVKIDLNALNNSNKPMVGSFSAAVVDENKVKTDEAAETSILSSLLLTSDLRGYIEQPNYYFTQVNEKTQTDLDILMLTQGYRRFEWKPLLAGNFTAPIYQPEKALQIAGTIKTLGGKPVPNAKITLFTTAGGTFILDTVADAQGHFAFKNMIFKDSIKFVLQARTPKNGKNVEIALDNNVGQAAAISKNRNLTAVDANTDSKLAAYLKYSKQQYDTETRYGAGNHTIVLKEVTITEKRRAALENSSNLNGPGNADQVITGDIFAKYGCPTLDACLQGRLTGVVFRGGIPYSTRSINQPMQVIVDGVYVESDYLQSLNTLDIASIEVLRTIGNTAIYGSRGGAGVLLINTKRGGDYTYNSSQIYAPGVITYTPKGYYKAREFYSPQYDDPKTNQAIADVRSTIYWKPNIITDDKGHASFEYFNAGTPGTYRVTVEGIDADGNIGRQVYRYTVR